MIIFIVGAAICRDSIWSPWINVHKVTPFPFPEENVTEDNPFGGGDVENMNQTARDKFCPPGLGVINRIECETTHGVSYDKTNQTGLICDVDKGFKCYNRRTKGFCKNYRIRLFCKCFGMCLNDTKPPF